MATLIVKPMRTSELTSPAKINLFLDVIGKRSDGYHDIVTVFEKIDLCDRIKLSDSREGIEISSDNSELPCGKENLAYQACSLLKKKYRVSKGVKIHIEKKIPIASGLGGGSSNAATTLGGLNKFWGLGISENELFALGEEIGADVPFFISNHSYAVGRGRGDDISPIKSDLEMWHVIISPPARLLSKEIYENLGLTEVSADVKMMVRAIEKKDLWEIKNHLYNELQLVAAKKVIDIPRIKDFAKARGFDAVCVSGSGPSIFVLNHNQKEAEGLRKELVNTFVPDSLKDEWKIFVAKTLTNTGVTES